MPKKGLFGGVLALLLVAVLVLLFVLRGGGEEAPTQAAVPTQQATQELILAFAERNDDPAARSSQEPQRGVRYTFSIKGADLNRLSYQEVEEAFGQRRPKEAFAWGYDNARNLLFLYIDTPVPAEYEARFVARNGQEAAVRFPHTPAAGASMGGNVPGGASPAASPSAAPATPVAAAKAAFAPTKTEKGWCGTDGVPGTFTVYEFVLSGVDLQDLTQEDLNRRFRRPDVLYGFNTDINCFFVGFEPRHPAGEYRIGFLLADGSEVGMSFSHTR